MISIDIQPTDFKHIGHYDETCSRCRRKIREEEVPLLLWTDDNPEGDKSIMWSYCEDCSEKIIIEELKR